MTAVERAKNRVTLLKEAEALAAHIRGNEAEHARLLEDRAKACRQLRTSGASNDDLQEVFGISRSRVQQLLRDHKD